MFVKICENKQIDVWEEYLLTLAAVPANHQFVYMMIILKAGVDAAAW